MTRLAVLTFVSAVGMAPLAIAQSAQPPQPTQPTRIPVLVPEQGTIPPKPDPQRHIADAQHRLEGIPTATLDVDGKKRLAQLREDFAKLTATYGQHSETSQAKPNQFPNQAAGGGDWITQFYQVERDLAGILGAGSSLNPTSIPAVGTATAGAIPGQPNVVDPSNPTAAGANAAQAAGAPGAAAPTGQVSPGSPPAPAVNGNNNAFNSAPAGTPTAIANAGGTVAPDPGAPAGTSGGAATGAIAATSANGLGAVAIAGVAVASIGVKNLDPQIRADLEQVRTSIELFYDATTLIGAP